MSLTLVVAVLPFSLGAHPRNPPPPLIHLTEISLIDLALVLKNAPFTYIIWFAVHVLG